MKTTESPLEIIFGGTFDPVHNGHLRLVAEIQLLIPDANIKLMPVGEPVHRQQTVATAAQRVEMLKLAIGKEPRISIDTLEIDKLGPSFSIDTLEQIKQKEPLVTIIWTMGVDAYLNLASWHRANELAKYCHLLVVERPGSKNITKQTDIAFNLGYKKAAFLNDFSNKNCGLEFHLTLPMLDISSTRIRELLANKKSTRWLIPDPVRSYIDDNELYTNTAHNLYSQKPNTENKQQTTGHLNDPN